MRKEENEFAEVLILGDEMPTLPLKIFFKKVLQLGKFKEGARKDLLNWDTSLEASQ